MTPTDSKQPLRIAQQMRKITYPGLLILAAVSSISAADDSDDTHYLSHGPLRSSDYYWVPSDSPDSEYDSELQDKAIDALVKCRELQEGEFGDRMVLITTAEENIRLCMLGRGWERRWTAPIVILRDGVRQAAIGRNRPARHFEVG